MDERLECLTLFLFLGGTGLQFSSRTLSVEGVGLAVAAIMLALAVRLWAWLRRRNFELAIRSNQGNTSGHDATENRNFD